MTSAAQIIGRFMEQAGTEHPRFLRPSSSNISIGSSKWRAADTELDTVYSYGRHFPLAQLMPNAETGDKRGWWLLNGDRYSVTTSQHQSETQRQAKKSGLPYMIVPESAINRAGIKTETIRPVEILPDRYTWEQRTRKDAPSDYELRHAGESDYYGRNWHHLDTGEWAYETPVHHLGEAVFEAKYSYYHREPAYTDLTTMQRVHPEGEYIEGSAYFLSGYDANEPGFGLYFLAQLREDLKPQTVAEAFEALKPLDVQYAERHQHLAVLRQGDVFAIPDTVSTRDLPGPSKRSEYVLGVNHQATEVRTDGMGNTYARGTLRHSPREWGRQPEHRRLKLGDGKTWYQLVRNTVPDGRSWAIGGKVD